MKKVSTKFKRCLAMLLAAFMLLSYSNIGIFAPVRAEQAQVPSQQTDPSVTLGVLIKENIDGLSSEEIAIITSGYLLADKTYSYQMPDDDDNLISVDAKTGKVTAKKYTDPVYGTQWIPTAYSLTNGTTAIAGYKNLPLQSSGDVYTGTYELVQTNPGNSFTVEVNYALDLTLSNEDVKAQQEMLDASYALAQDIALMMCLDSVSVIGDDEELADQIVSISGGLIKDPTKVYADTILEFLAMELKELGDQSAIDLIYQLVKGIEIPYVEEIDFENGEVVVSEETLRLGKDGREAATSLYNQKNGEKHALNLVAFMSSHNGASYLELLVKHGAELESALVGNYEDIDYLSNLNSYGGLKNISNNMKGLIEEFDALQDDIYDELNTYLKDMDRTVSSVEDLKALIAEIEAKEADAYSTVNQQLAGLDADTKKLLQEYGAPAKVEDAASMAALKNAVVKAYTETLAEINKALAEMDESVKAELKAAGAPDKITVADVSSAQAFKNSGDADINDLTKLENAMKTVRGNALKEADAQLQKMLSEADADTKAALLDAGAPSKIETVEDLKALQNALANVKSTMLSQIDSQLQEIYKANPEMKQKLINRGAPQKVAASSDLTNLKKALVEARADLLSATITEANAQIKTLRAQYTLLARLLPEKISTENELLSLINTLSGLPTYVPEETMTAMNTAKELLETLAQTISAVEAAEAAVAKLDDAQSALQNASDAIAAADEVIATLGEAKTALATIKPYIVKVLEANEQVEQLNNKVLPLLNKVVDGLTQLEEGVATLTETQKQLDMLILVMQAFCQTVKPAYDAYTNNTWKAPALLNTAANPDYARLTILASGMEQTKHTAKPVLHVADTTVAYKMDMYDVTVEYKAVIVDPAKTDSTETVGLTTKTYTVTMTKDATAAEILAEIAAKVDEEAILAGWAIDTQNYDRNTTVLPEALTENTTYTITYTPKLMDVTFGEGFDGAPAIKVPYGYRMTLPKLEGDVTKEYTYQVNDQKNLDQGTVVTITGATAISREEGAVSAKQYLTDLVVNTNPGMDALVKNILQNQALNRGQAISIRVPGKDQLVVEIADDASSATISALPFGSRVGDKNWIAESAVIDGVSVSLTNGVYVETANPGFDKVTVEYKLALTAAALGITDEQLLATMNIPYELVTDYKYQKATLDALSDPEIMKLLTQLNAQDLVIENPSKMTLKEALGKIEDLNNLLELGLGAEAVAAAKKLYNLIPDAGYISLYYTLQQYTEQGMFHYYKNEQTYINQITELNDIMTQLVSDEGFVKLIPASNMATFEAIQKVLGDAASLAKAENAVNKTLINVSSPYLNSLLASLEAAQNTTLTHYTQAPGQMIWTAVIEQPGPGKRTVTMSVNFNGAEKTDSITVDFGATLSYSEMTAWAQSLAKELGLSDELAAYYAAAYSFGGDITAGNNVELSASWTLRDYTVTVEGSSIGTVNYENREITLADHADANFQYRYYINNELYSAGTYTLTLAQFKALTEGKLVITREEINLAENALIKLIDNMNGAAVLTKDANGEYAVILRVNPETAQNDLANFVIGLFMTEYKYIALGGSEFYSGQFHMQALVDAVLNSGISTDSLMALIDSNGNITGNLTLDANTQVLNSVAPAYLNNLGGVLMQTTMDFGADAQNTTGTKFYITMAGSASQLQQVRNALAQAKNLGVTFNLNKGRMNLMMKLPDQAYGAYLAALTLVGEADIKNVNDVDAQAAVGYMLQLLNPVFAEGVTTQTLTNSMNMLGKSGSLNAYDRYFELIKDYYNIDTVTYEGDTAVLPLENVDINPLVNKLQGYVDGIELPEGFSIDLTKLIYEYNDPSTTADDETAGLDVAASVTLENLAVDYAAMFLDIRAEGVLNKFGMWTAEELIAGSDDFAGASVIVLVDDVTGNLSINTTTVLDLNGKTLAGNITAGDKANLIIIDTAYESDHGTVTGTVTGNVTILDGKYNTDVSKFLSNGYQQNGEGVVNNNLYTTACDENGNITVTLNASPAELKELLNKQSVTDLAIEIVAGLVVNNYTNASLSIEGGKIYDICLNDALGLYAGTNRADAVVDTALSWITAPDLANLVNIVAEDLTDFAALEAALTGNGQILSYKTTIAPWAVEVEHIADGDYLTLNIGASDKTVDAQLNIAVSGSLQSDLAQLAGAMKDTVKVDVTTKMEEITRDENSVIHVVGSFSGVVEIDFTQDPNYIIMMAVLLADGADSTLKAKLEAGIEAYYETGSLYAMEPIFKALTAKQICDSLRSHARSELFTDAVNALALSAETKQAILSTIGDDEMGYDLAIDAIGYVLRQLEARKLLEGATDSTRALGTLEKTDETGKYFGFTRDKRFTGERALFRSYKLGYDLDITEVTVKVRLFGDHVHVYKDIVDEKYLKSEATCTELAVYYKSCAACGHVGTETFTYGELKAHDFTAEVAEDKYLKSAATCTELAVYYKSCSVCGQASDSETFTYGTLAEHIYDQEVATEKYLKSEATCTEAAVYYKSCVCGEIGTETFTYGEANGHKLIEKVDAKYLKSAATCTEAAVYYKSCSVCGEASTETFTYGEANGHTMTEKVDAKYLKSAATCTEPAVYYKSCSVCGEASTETFTYGEPAGHKLEKVERKEATATEEGNIQYWRCSVCGKLFADDAAAKEITLAETVIAKLPTVGVPVIPTGDKVYGYMADPDAGIIFIDAAANGITVEEFTKLISAAVTNDTDGKAEIKVEGFTETNLICTTAKVTLTAQNIDGVLAVATYDIVVMGDTNCNGRIESGDGVRIDKHYLGAGEMSGLVLLAADTNRNGRIESGDGVKIDVKYLNGAKYTTALKK